MLRRPRRNRKSPAIRALTCETILSPSNLIQPYFVTEGPRSSIQSLPGTDRLPLDDLLEDATQAFELGIPAILLFAVVPNEKKDEQGSEALNPDGIIPRAIQLLKRALPDLCVMADIALDVYSTKGHDGLVDEQGEVVNDPTVEVLSRWAVMLGQVGVDFVAPSDMMDGRVGAIRTALDEAALEQVSILSYSAKYASAHYGPFREALDSTPRFGDKLTYQLRPSSRREALLEAMLDEEEGADMLMVKPALTYLDIIREVRDQTTLPLAAFHVSGEYSMLLAAEQNGWVNGDQALIETLTSIRRAGADVILTWAAKRASKLLGAKYLQETVHSA